MRKLFFWIALLLAAITVCHSCRSASQLRNKGTEAERKHQYERAIKLYKKATDKGDVLAPFYLGNMYYQGKGVKTNEREALIWYKKSAERGYSGAQSQVGYFYFTGEGTSVNTKAGIDWMTKAANNGNAVSQFNLGQIYGSGMSGTEKDDTKSTYWFSKAAGNGYISAYYYYGKNLLLGIGCQKDANAAYNYLVKAKQNNDYDACYYLGMIYENGLGSKKVNYELALEEYRNAANKGDKTKSDAISSINKLQNYVKSNTWLIGWKYYMGSDGFPTNTNKAVETWRMGANNGDSKCQYYLGLCYAKGMGLEINETEAFNWYLKSAQNGYIDAQYTVGCRYYHGRGVSKSKDKGKYWMEIAAKNGSPSAKQFLEKLSKWWSLSPCRCESD